MPVLGVREPNDPLPQVLCQRSLDTACTLERVQCSRRLTWQRQADVLMQFWEHFVGGLATAGCPGAS